MPRKARLNVPGSIYHAMSRYLDHYALFNDDEDSEFFFIAHSADQQYRTPQRLIAEFLNGGAMAISELSRNGG